jgi:cell division septation protein DedD
LIDAVALSDVPLRTLCPRCDAPFRISLSDEQAPRELHAATTTLARVTQAARQQVVGVASAIDDAEDMLALPRAESRDELIVQPTCTVFDWEDELAPPRHANVRTADDKYRVGARLLSASPLWLLVVGFAFLSLAVLCDRLLATADGARADATTYGSLENQATNRDAARRHARDDSTRGDSQVVSDAETDSSASEAEASDEIKPAPVSDTVAPRADADAQVVAASRADARQELTANAPVSEPSSTRLTLQLASYRLEEEAQKLAEKLQAAGFEARVITEQHSKRPWYNVQTKVFDTREDAERHLAELRAKNFASSYTVREVD